MLSCALPLQSSSTMDDTSIPAVIDDNEEADEDLHIVTTAAEVAQLFERNNIGQPSLKIPVLTREIS